jgi:hypothetical protein
MTQDSGLEAASSDGSGGAPVDPTKGCAGLNTKPTFCSDFDDGKSLENEGFVVETVGDGTLGIDNKTAESPPNSMLATTASGSGYADVSYIVTSAPRSVVIVAWVFVEKASTGDFQLIRFQAQAANGDNYQLLVLDSESGQTFLEQMFAAGSGAQTTGMDQRIGAIPPRVWTRIEVDITFGSATHATETIGSATIFDGNLKLVWAIPAAQIVFGIGYGPSDPVSVRVDNVVVDLKP